MNKDGYRFYNFTYWVGISIDNMIWVDLPSVDNNAGWIHIKMNKGIISLAKIPTSEVTFSQFMKRVNQNLKIVISYHGKD